MAVPHASSGQVIDVRPLGGQLKKSVTTTLVKTDRMEVIRLAVPAGKEVPEHRVPGEITVQCLEGRVNFSAQGQKVVLEAGQMLFLAGGEPHALEGLADSSLLITILLEHKF